MLSLSLSFKCTPTQSSSFLHSKPTIYYTQLNFPLSRFPQTSLSLSLMAPASFHGKTVCVMDASGPLGAALVHSLLHRGYTVHATLLQPHGDDREVNGLYDADGNNNNNHLKIFQSDPFDYRSIMDALKGCCGLFYTFESPHHSTTYDDSMVEDEVRAAHNVVEACAQTDTIAKVVFTSSVTAVIWRDNRKSIDLDERHWSDINLCRKFKLWHGLSKTLSEKTAWALAMDREVNMVCVNPGLIMSPHLSITHPYLKGAAEMYEDGLLVTVDLDFLVNSQICIYEDVSTYGRYLCFNHTITTHDDAVLLAKALAPHATPPPPSDHETRIIQHNISNKKLNKLMMNFGCGTQAD